MMLWWKAWMETRWRLAFALACFAFLWAEGPLFGVPLAKLKLVFLFQYALVWAFAATMLAGAGLNSQTTWGMYAGYHGSMLFTLSLPVARRKLFAVRAAAGAVETCALIVVSAVPLVRFFGLSWSTASLYVAGACVCSMAAYAISALFACVTGEMWQLYGSWGALGALGLSMRYAPLARFNPLRGFLLSAYTTAVHPHVTPASLPVPLVREPLQSAFASAPWIDAWLGSALLATLCCFAAARILDRKEY